MKYMEELKSYLVPPFRVTTRCHSRACVKTYITFVGCDQGQRCRLGKSISPPAYRGRLRAETFNCLQKLLADKLCW